MGDKRKPLESPLARSYTGNLVGMGRIAATFFPGGNSALHSRLWMLRHPARACGLVRGGGALRASMDAGCAPHFSVKIFAR